MSTDGQGTLWRRNIAENFNRLSRAHERYRRQTDRQTDDRRQTTDGRTMTYSERELEFTFAKNYKTSHRVPKLNKKVSSRGALYLSSGEECTYNFPLN